MNVTIKIKDRTRTKLENLKLYTDETYDDVIERLLKTQDCELDIITIKNLRKSLADIEKGRIHSLERVEKELCNKLK